jgi:hypothetical protein
VCDWQDNSPTMSWEVNLIHQVTELWCKKILTAWNDSLKLIEFNGDKHKVQLSISNWWHTHRIRGSDSHPFRLLKMSQGFWLTVRVTWIGYQKATWTVPFATTKEVTVKWEKGKGWWTVGSLIRWGIVGRSAPPEYQVICGFLPSEGIWEVTGSGTTK